MNNHSDPDTKQVYVHDCIGIGFGPSNISLAIALEEKGLLANSLFLEARGETCWQPGMLIEGTDIQHNPLRDFVTPRNPCSPYGFLSYLKSKDRLFDYLNLSAPFPPRTEYASYVAWVAQQFEDYVEFNQPVLRISNETDAFGNDFIEIKTTNETVYRARSIVIGCGRSRNIPVEFESLLNENIIHSDDYTWAKEKWLKKRQKPKIAVIGGSQSAVEILLDLCADCEVFGINRSFGFKQKDLSPFTESIYYPKFVDYFHNSGVTSQNHITKELWRSNYSAADHDVIDALNFKLYEQKVTGKRDIELFHNSIIEEIKVNPNDKGYTISLRDRHNQKQTTLSVDGVVFATGYKNFGKSENQEHHHPLLEGIAADLNFREDGGPEVLRDYRVSCSKKFAPVYLNGLCESTHGFGDAGSFSILSIRGELIAASLREQITSHPDKETYTSGVLAHV